MEENEYLMKFFAQVDKLVGVLGPLGVHLPDEDVYFSTRRRTYDGLRIKTMYDIVRGPHHPCRDRGNS